MQGWSSPIDCASSRSITPWCADHVDVGWECSAVRHRRSPQRLPRDDWCPDPYGGRRPSATALLLLLRGRRVDSAAPTAGPAEEVADEDADEGENGAACGAQSEG